MVLTSLRSNSSNCKTETANAQIPAPKWLALTWNWSHRCCWCTLAESGVPNWSWSSSVKCLNYVCWVQSSGQCGNSMEFNDRIFIQGWSTWSTFPGWSTTWDLCLRRRPELPETLSGVALAYENQGPKVNGMGLPCHGYNFKAAKVYKKNMRVHTLHIYMNRYQ